MTREEITLAVLLGFWLTASVVGQFSFKWIQRCRRWDWFSLIPIWTFFAPNPGNTDTHLIYRDMDTEGRVGPWNEIPLVPKRHWTMAFWYPQKRSKKVISDVLNALAQYLNAETETDVTVDEKLSFALISTPYLIVLNVVSNVPRDASTVARQFALVESFGYCAAWNV